MGTHNITICMHALKHIDVLNVGYEGYISRKIPYHISHDIVAIFK